MPGAMPTPPKPHLSTLPFPTPRAWESWLKKNHATAPGVWLKFAKKSSGIPTVVYKDALDVALCYGWIDGLVRTLDADYYVQRFTPRRPRSKWSQINCNKADALIAAGKMQPAGLRHIQAAKSDGRWESAYGSPKTITVPADFKKALAANPAAKTFFATLTGRNHYAILYRLYDAKRPETRARRIAQYIKMLNEQRRPYDSP
jgi:uncharacterized protein YdeI (YjbR/CyaY-like superfamily)